MKPQYFCSLFLILLSYHPSQAHPTCNLKGEWIIKKGRLFKNYEIARPYSNNRITFSSDSVELASGFFYNILSLDAADSRIGKFPFIYYGNKEYYETHGDSLFVYSSPYQTWAKFRIYCAENGNVTLTGETESLLLTKNVVKSVTPECTIRYINVEVDEGPMSAYNVHYKCTYTLSDSMIFEQMDSLGLEEKRFQLPRGSFQKICSELSKYVDLLGLVRKFPTQEYDFGKVYLQIGLNDGRFIKAEIQNRECPEGLWFSLIPVLYGHQKMMYSELSPVEF